MEKSKEILMESTDLDQQGCCTWQKIRMFKTVMLVFPFAAMVSELTSV